MEQPNVTILDSTYRISHLQRHLFAPEPVLAVLNPGEEMAVTNWLWSIEQRRARMWEEARGQKTEDRNRQTSPDERGRNPSPLAPLPAGEGNSEFGAVPSSGLPSTKSGLGQVGGDLRCALKLSDAFVSWAIKCSGRSLSNTGIRQGWFAAPPRMPRLASAKAFFAEFQE